jgi:hypothetical protein
MALLAHLDAGCLRDVVVVCASARVPLGGHGAGLQPAPALGTGQRLHVPLLLHLSCRVVVQVSQGSAHLRGRQAGGKGGGGVACLLVNSKLGQCGSGSS